MANSISSIDTPNNVIVTTQEGNTINIPQTTINTVKVNSIGPQGPQGPTGSGADVGISPTNVYLTPVKIVCQDANNINLSGSAYTSSGMFELNWTGNSGNMVMYLPDATSSNNTYRAIRFITNGSYEVNTRTYLTPSGSQTLDGNAESYEINKAYEGIMVWSDGVEWFRIQTKA
jgi:hypothetical protein